MNWNSPTAATIKRKGKNRRNIELDVITKKFVRVNNPERPHKIELTKDDKKRLIEDFKKIIGREPTEEEALTLEVEERKIKQKGGDSMRDYTNQGSSNK